MVSEATLLKQTFKIEQRDVMKNIRGRKLDINPPSELRSRIHEAFSSGPDLLSLSECVQTPPS